MLLLLAGTANAEKFKCQSGSYWSTGGKIIVRATINEDGVTGTITVAGTMHKTIYYVQGFDRRWDFGIQDDLTYNYSFVMNPDGTALYYDFSRTDAGETISAR
jgi:hypothetical protein